ncbi:phage antirepressor [Dietzia sp. MNB45]|uniref:phage antirepressor n=1 Tax=Dietzia sp. MNB45 TaxID=3238800 RepID=UPI003F80A230
MSEHHATGTLVPFNYGDAQVRVVSIEGEPWFVLADLCRVLGLTRGPSQIAERLDDGVRQTYPIRDALGRHQNATVVSEAGMYEVVIRSDKPEAAAFRRWITGTVLPEIRRTGSYGAPAFDPASLSRQEILRLALNAEEERLALEAENKVLAPKAEAYDDFLDATGKYGVGAVAKMLGSSQNKLFRDLRNAGVFIAKGPMRNTPYQKYMHHFEVKAHTFERSNGEQGTSYTTYVQPSGIAFIQRKLGLLAIDPLPMSEAVAS